MELRLSSTFLLLALLLASSLALALAQKPGNFGEDLSQAQNKTCSGPDCLPSSDQPGVKQSTRYKQKLQKTLQDGTYLKKKSSKRVKKDRLPDETPTNNTNFLWQNEETSNSSSSRVVPKKEAAAADSNDTYAYPLHPPHTVLGESVVPKKGVPDFDNSTIVAKKGVDDDIFPSGEGGGSPVVPRKGAAAFENSTIVAKKGVDSSFASDAPTVPRKGAPAGSPVSPRKGAVDDAYGDQPSFVSGRKGVQHNDDNLNRLSSSNNSSSGLNSAEEPHSKAVATPEVVEKVDPTPNTSLLVGLVFGLLLLAVLGFLVFKRVDATRKRREYRRMNDFLIDGMYNDL